MMLAGASAVQVGAQNLVDPWACEKIVRELPAVMEEYGIENLSDIIGGAHRGVTDVIVACDFQSRERVMKFLDCFKDQKPYVKIGMELFYAEGPQIVREIKARGHKIFLDLKLCDIPNTVSGAMRGAARPRRRHDEPSRVRHDRHDARGGRGADSSRTARVRF